MSSYPEDPAPAGPTTGAPSKLLLEAPPARDDSDTIKLNVGTSEKVSLYDKLGPSIVSSDGVISRIGNWAEMGPDERARVLRVLGARNKIRLEALRDGTDEEPLQEMQEIEAP